MDYGKKMKNDDSTFYYFFFATMKSELPRGITIFDNIILFSISPIKMNILLIQSGIACKSELGFTVVKPLIAFFSRIIKNK